MESLLSFLSSGQTEEQKPGKKESDKRRPLTSTRIYVFGFWVPFTQLHLRVWPSSKETYAKPLQSRNSLLPRTCTF